MVGCNCDHSLKSENLGMVFPGCAECVAGIDQDRASISHFQESSVLIAAMVRDDHDAVCCTGGFYVIIDAVPFPAIMSNGRDKWVVIGYICAFLFQKANHIQRG